MRYLTKTQYRKAAQFLEQQARPLEAALFNYHFQQGSTEDVYQELAFYQNPDGGYGQGLEPDVRTPSSSALASGMALYQLQELGCESESPLVKNCVGYLKSTLNGADCVWRVVPRDTNFYPHAPWWHDQDGSLRNLFAGFKIIPRVLILSSLVYYRELLHDDWLNPLLEDAVEYLEQTRELGTGGGSDLEYAIKLAETDHLPQKFRARITDRVRKAVPTAVNCDPEEWNSYTLHPLQAAPRKTTFTRDLIPEAVEEYLDYLISHQSVEGCWDPTWSWGEGWFEDEWQIAEKEWRGILTLETLLALQSYGRLRE